MWRRPLPAVSSNFSSPTAAPRCLASPEAARYPGEEEARRCRPSKNYHPVSYKSIFRWCWTANLSVFTRWIRYSQHWLELRKRVITLLNVHLCTYRNTQVVFGMFSCSYVTSSRILWSCRIVLLVKWCVLSYRGLLLLQKYRYFFLILCWDTIQF